MQFNAPNYIVPLGAMQAKLPHLIRLPVNGFLIGFALCGHAILARDSLNLINATVRRLGEDE